mmetsp:Transcript_2202/g.3263  ORF Transcript_2202/g.3263 Transcript_2202/m.3263 type:complete len:112 (-) Transcript_2202:225-560(-)|eukprot:CAMPEP_0113944390 /NCGR_PEP_ID=MMETSP1339-20121228/34226_1 /TAXON_ID=94617 /ORGANISM="Fibrocapsa japonica" /LENGTH=111 /DNA_ID=CAMNT_0000949585 /DNA_START=81 /DNA_END=416 /DNA_ORIENTATION=+ /assembly_acc=CAM_ASM_000762
MVLVAGAATSKHLWSCSDLISTECAEANLAFYECKAKTQDPSKCVVPGVSVTNCVNNLVVKADTKCGEIMQKLTDCLEQKYGEFSNCRELQTELRNCYHGSDQGTWKAPWL